MPAFFALLEKKIIRPKNGNLLFHRSLWMFVNKIFLHHVEPKNIIKTIRDILGGFYFAPAIGHYYRCQERMANMNASFFAGVAQRFMPAIKLKANAQPDDAEILFKFYNKVQQNKWPMN